MKTTVSDLIVKYMERLGIASGLCLYCHGRPLSFYCDDAKHELMLAGMMRGFMMSGWRPGQKILYLWGASRDVAPGGCSMSVETMSSILKRPYRPWSSVRRACGSGQA